LVLPATIACLAAYGPFPGAYPGDAEVIGAVETHEVRQGESLIEIARAHDLGFNAIAAANPELDPYVPGTGARVEVPTAFIVPRTAAPGTIVVNLSEMRLYYSFLGHGGVTRTLVTAPVGIGDEGASTPVGIYRVVEKEAKPAWHVPASIRREEPDLPEVVPAGPANPLGTHALRLSSRSILIHGTNKPWGVGRRVSHGCIRMYPEDIVWLYRLVPIGTEVVVERAPVKVGLEGERVYVEVHADDDLKADYFALAQDLLLDRAALGRVDPMKLDAAIRERRGIPVDVTLELPRPPLAGDPQLPCDERPALPQGAGPPSGRAERSTPLSAEQVPGSPGPCRADAASSQTPP